MGRFGCVVMAVGIIALLVVIVLPIMLTDNPSLNHFLERMLCDWGEIYSSEPYATANFDGTAFNLTAYCVGEDGTRRDVTDTQTFYGLVGFLAPFLLGLTLFIVGVGRNAAKAQVAARNSRGEPYVSPLVAPAEPPDPTLSERLQQIDEAYKKRLITRDEYEQARKKAIDESNF